MKIKSNQKNHQKKLQKKLQKNHQKNHQKKIISNINWNVIKKNKVKKIIFNKNKILIKFDNLSSLNIGFTKISNESTWFEKFIKANIINEEPLYNPDNDSNNKVSKLFKFSNKNKFIEYENLVGKKIKSIKWVGDCWTYQINKLMI